MSSSTVFYLLGGLLVASAVLLAFTGLRREGSFPSRSALIGVTGLFAALVAATMTVSVLQAEDEQEHREAELAEHEEEAAAEAEGPASGGVVDQEQGATPAGGALEPGPGPAEEPTGEGGQSGGGAGAGNVLDVTSPEDGSLVFEPDGLEATAGAVTLVYDNPSPVQHNIALEFEGEEIAATETVADRKVELRQRLQPGEYVFYCAVPGHREGGMEGDLTVTGPEQP
jgi:plastocyanin